MKTLKQIFFSIILFCLTVKVNGQSEIKVTDPGVIVTNNSDHNTANGAVFHVNSNSQGVIFPRLTAAQRDNIVDPEPGLLIFNKDICAYQYWNSEEWVSMGELLNLTTPENPTDFTAVPSGNQVTLNWTDNSTVEKGFVIERSTDNANFLEVGTTSADATSYVDTPENNGIYYYRLQAENGCASSDYTAAIEVLFIDFSGWYAELTTRFAPEQFNFVGDPNSTFAVSEWLDHNGSHDFSQSASTNGNVYWEGNDITGASLYNGFPVLEPEDLEASDFSQWNFLHDGTSDYTLFMAVDLRGAPENYRIRPLNSGVGGTNGLAILLDGEFNGRDDQIRIFQGVPATEVITTPDQKVKMGFNVFCLRLNTVTNELDIFVKHQEIDKEKFTGTADLSSGDSSSKLRLKDGPGNFYLEFLAKKSAMTDAEVNQMLDLLFDYYN